MSVRLVSIFTLALGSTFALEQVAEACSGCTPQTFFPIDGSEVPANVIGIASQYAFDGPVSLIEVDSMVEVPVEIVDNVYETIAVPSEALEPGHTYQLEFPMHFCGGPTSVVVNAIEPVALPEAELGTLVADEAELGIVPAAGDAMCSVDLNAAYIDIELELDPALAQLEPYLMYETQIDGQRWVHETSEVPSPSIGRSWRGRGRDRIVWLCEDDDGIPLETGLSSGPMSVRMVARLPGLPDTVYASNEIEIELDCELDDTDGETGADTGTPADGESQGSCSITNHKPPPLATLALLMLALPGLRRRNQRLGSAPATSSATRSCR